jgi:hypothetical protein
MMRAVAILLLLANMAVAAYFLVADRTAPRETDPSRQQINADAIRVLATGSDALALSRARSTEDSRKPSVLSCATLSSLQETQVASAETRLASLGLGERLSRTDAGGGASSYLVLIPPIPRRADLNRRIDELIATGISDHFVIADGELRYGISLGFFKTEDAANRHLAYLKGKGVTDAIIRPRNPGSRTATLVMKDLTGAERTEVEAIARDLPGTDLRIQACPGAETQG